MDIKKLKNEFDGAVRQNAKDVILLHFGRIGFRKMFQALSTDVETKEALESFKENPVFNMFADIMMQQVVGDAFGSKLDKLSTEKLNGLAFAIIDLKEEKNSEA